MRTDIESRINEAEVCRSMRLFDDCLKIYEGIISLIAPEDDQVRVTIAKRIEVLKNEISEEKKTNKNGRDTEEVLTPNEKYYDETGASDMLGSAAAFQEMGLHAEALDEYGKILMEDYPHEKVIPLITESLLKLHAPDKAVAEFNRLVGQQQVAGKKSARLKFLLGLEFEKRDHREQAHDLYKEAARLEPSDIEIKKRLDSIAAASVSGSKFDYLLNEDIATTEQLQQAFTLSKKMKKSVEHVLIEHFHIDKEAIGKSFADFYRCPYRAYDASFPIPVELLTNLKKAFLLNALWVPLSWDKDGIEVLVDDPRDLNKTDNIKALMRTEKINFSVAIREDIQEFIRSFFNSDRQKSELRTADEELDEYDLIPDISFEEEDEEEDSAEADEASSQVVKLVDQTIIAAYRKNASDIHIEPSPITKSTSIRFRLDGVCHEYMKIPNSIVRGVVSRIKIMSNLDIAERRLPQDGKIKFRRKGVPAFELRVATLPTAGGYEDVVLRILASAGAMKIDEMGLTQRNLDVLTKISVNPYGLILAVGPTGSGKTTTLHAILNHINTPGIKIWTAEDPIEITQAGLRQTEVKPKIGLTFARMMRAFLRADPDVIMIGEMRDEETASIGIEASLTGHLVFSTLHTNSAPETITRLLDMGLNPLNFSDAFLGVLAQRLTRRLCTKCRAEYELGENEYETLAAEYGSEHFYKTGVEYDKGMTLCRAVGCEKCSSTGYRGRMGIHELMEGTPEIKLMIKRQSNTETIFEQAIKEGMATLKQDGILKVFQGATDLAEVRRVCIN
jgi:type II secretory ATPase GspE/PulE/Tfp pilus assembly ATPase PilB-like protein